MLAFIWCGPIPCIPGVPERSHLIDAFCATGFSEVFEKNRNRLDPMAVAIDEPATRQSGNRRLRRISGIRLALTHARKPIQWRSPAGHCPKRAPNRQQSWARRKFQWLARDRLRLEASPLLQPIGQKRSNSPAVALVREPTQAPKGPRYLDLPRSSQGTYSGRIPASKALRKIGRLGSRPKHHYAERSTAFGTA